ncbi:hypothetical protein [Streptomyces adustus]|uniref:hypothetical protein n=1 Tax=Streptomyces adustus TaxID=1609272 RepID=UPI0030840FBD
MREAVHPAEVLATVQLFVPLACPSEGQFRVRPADDRVHLRVHPLGVAQVGLHDLDAGEGPLPDGAGQGDGVEGDDVVHEVPSWS